MDTATVNAGLANRANSSANGLISSDFETFLQMLTVQMQNQDPLNPMESTEFATQLATFSSVEQQVLTNDLLTQLGAQFNAVSVSQLANWVGMEAKVMAAGYFDGETTVEVVPYPLGTADAAELVVTNEDGEEVARIEIPTDSEPFEWSGLDDDGEPLPEGLYNFNVESYVNGEVVETLPAEVYTQITEARTTSSGIFLVLEGGAIVESDFVTGLRAPS